MVDTDELFGFLALQPGAAGSVDKTSFDELGTEARRWPIAS